MPGDRFLDALSEVRGNKPASDPFMAALSEVRAEDATPKPSLLQRAIPAGMRILPTVAGGFLGSALGPLGTAAGGAAGASLGEYAAAHLSGVLSFEDTLFLIVTRARLIAQVSGVGAAMLAVPLPEAALREILPASISLATRARCLAPIPLTANALSGSASHFSTWCIAAVLTMIWGLSGRSVSRTESALDSSTSSCVRPVTRSPELANTFTTSFPS